MNNREFPFNQPIHPEDNQSINKAFDRNYGNRIKSGDTTPLKYTIKDGDGEPLDKQRLLDMDVTAILKHEDIVAYETEAIVTLEDETENYAGDLVAKFTIQEALAPSATPYILEFHFEDGESSDRFIFPSANNLDIYITHSALSSDDEAIEKSSEQRLKEIVESSQTLTDVKTQEEERIANEEARQAKYIELVDTGIMQENINQKLSESEQTYAPRLTNLEQNDAELTTQLAQTAKGAEIADSMAIKVSQGYSDRKPTLSFTLDDAYAEDFTVAKPLFDELGVKGTIYHNHKPEGMGLSDEQIIQLHKEGWEFGGHTKDHIYMSSFPCESALSGDNKIITSGTEFDFFDGMETEVRIVDVPSRDYGENAKVINITNLSGKQELTLSKPLRKSYNSPYVRYSDSFIDKQITYNIKYLSKLNVPCKHFAYPYGTAPHSAQKLVQKRYASGRGALDNRAGFQSNGGVVEYIERTFNQYNITAGDLSYATEEWIDDLLDEVIATNGMGVVLAHSRSFNWEQIMRYAVDGARLRGVDIVTLGEALEHHGNLIDLGDVSVSHGGNLRGGIRILEPNTIPNEGHSVNSYDKGINIVRSTQSDSGYPSGTGTLASLKIGEAAAGEGSGWNPELFFTRNGRIFYRNSLGFAERRPWQELARTENFVVNVGEITINPKNSFTYQPDKLYTTNLVTVQYALRNNNGLLRSININHGIIAGRPFLNFYNPGDTQVTVDVGSVNFTIIFHD